MNKVEYVKDQVDRIISKIYNETIKRNAYVHTYSVWMIANLYSKYQQLDSEILQVAALLHDIAKYQDNCGSKEHALKSSFIAIDILKASKLFTLEEITLISKMISYHSDKANIHHNPYIEAIKDCDLLARYFDEPNLVLNNQLKHRLYYALEKIHYH